MQINYWTMSLYTGITLGVLHFSVLDLHIWKFSLSCSMWVLFFFFSLNTQGNIAIQRMLFAFLV